jgi:hypothetical protein
MNCRYCDKVIIDYEKITIQNVRGLKRVFHTNCFFKAIGTDVEVSKMMLRENR